MGKISQFFRAFVEGSTISDGRQITAEMIDECVATFNRETYEPRINIEHIPGFSPEPPFNAYGSIVAVKAQDDDITIAGKTEKRRALYVQVDANEQLQALHKKGQKIFPSVELTPSYSGCGKIGLVGMAFTDTPASIATQKLQFSRSAPGTIFAADDLEVALGLADDVPDAKGIAAVFAAALAAVGFKAGEAQPEKKPEPVLPAPPANDNAALFAALGTAVGDAVEKATAPISAAVARLTADQAALKAGLENSEAPGFSRQPSTGGNGGSVTDC